jgi:hypothetical protein
MSEPITLPAPKLDWPPPENKWQRERRAFLKLYPQLLQTHRGKYVAIHEGRLVDSGEELVPLALRVYQRHGYVPIYMDLVTDEPQPPVRIPSPRLQWDKPAK